jgi:hypothetical protein
MSSTIIAGNLDRSSAALFPDWNCNGGVYSQDHNLIGATDGCPVTLDPSDQSGTAANPLDPQLAPLASNGGPMRTSRLSATSPAVNAGDPGTPGAGGTPCEATDQRGVPRQLGGLCDIGAYERVTCHSRLVNVVGTSGSDSLEGSSRKDGILGLGGRDTLNGAGGKDGLCGGSGRDRLFGGSGNDFLDGGSGHDICDGGAGSDKSRRCEARLSIP